MRFAIIALMLMLGSRVGFSYRKLGTKCETKNVEMETLNRNRIDYTRIPQVTFHFNAHKGGKCIIFEHVNDLEAANYGSPRGCERNL